MRTITLDVTIPADRRLVLNLPEDVETGRTEIKIIIGKEPDVPKPKSLKEHIEWLNENIPGRSRKELDKEIQAMRDEWD